MSYTPCGGVLSRTPTCAVCQWSRKGVVYGGTSVEPTVTKDTVGIWYQVRLSKGYLYEDHSELEQQQSAGFRTPHKWITCRWKCKFIFNLICTVASQVSKSLEISIVDYPGTACIEKIDGLMNLSCCSLPTRDRDEKTSCVHTFRFPSCWLTVKSVWTWRSKTSLHRHFTLSVDAHVESGLTDMYFWHICDDSDKLETCEWCCKRAQSQEHCV